MDDEFVIVLTTMPEDGVLGAQFADTLVREQLAACVNLLPPMASVYRWEGQVARDVERQLVIKTRRGHVAAIEERLRALHPYDVPELLVLRIVQGSPAYLNWIAAST